VPTPTPAKKTARTSRAKQPTSNRRAAKKPTSGNTSAVANGENTGQAARRLPSGQPEQLMILVGALIFGIAGLFLHVLVVVSLVLMALLLGMIAAEARGQRGRGIISEVVNEAKVVLDEIKKPGQTDTDDSPEQTTTT
jgi:Flp pilus assembly protein TadB